MWFALISFIISAINLLIGLTVYYYNNKDIANITFRNLMLAISSWCFSVVMNYISPDKEIAFRWTICGLVSAFFIAPCFAHFCFAILKKYKFLTPPIVIFLYVPCLVIIPLVLLDPGIFVEDVIPNPGGGYYIINNPSFYPSLGLYISLLTIIGLYTVITSRRITSNILPQSIFIGFILAVIPCLIINFVLYPKFNILYVYVSPLFTLTFPCSVVYALIRSEGLMNIRLREILGDFIVKLITYTFLILTSLILFFTVLYITKWMWHFTFETNLLSNILWYLPVVGLVVFVSAHFKKEVYILVYKIISGYRRIFWREKFSTLSLNLKKATTNEEGIELIKEHLPEIINTDIYYLLIYNQETDTFEIIDSNIEEVKDKQLPLGKEDALIQRINIGNNLMIISEIESDISFEKGISIFKRYKVELCLPVRLRKELAGIICLGKRNFFPHYDLEQKKEISRLIYLDALPFIQGYLESKFRNPPYIISIYICDIPDTVVNSKDEHLLEYLLNPDRVRIKIVKDRNIVLTEDLELIPPEKIIFNYIVYTAYINAVFDKYPQWDTIPCSKRIFSKELANSQGWVAKALSVHYGYVPVESRIRQWISNIRQVLTKMDAADLIPRDNTFPRGRGKGYTINGKIILLKENVSKL